MPHIAVIGAGSVGSAVARELSRRGARVTVYEARHPGAGTSTTSFAWVNSSDKQPRTYHDLNVLGMAAHRELQQQPAGGPAWFHPTGRLEWAEEGEHAADLAGRIARLGAWGYASHWLSREEALELEPDLRIPAGVPEVGHFPDEGYVLPALLLSRLLGEARDRGAVVRAPAVVEAIESTALGTRLRLAGGAVDEAEVVVSCAGRWSTCLLATAGHHVPLVDPEAAGSAAVGFLAWTAPLAARLRRVVTAPNVTARPDGGGRLLLQHVPLDATADPARAPSPEDPVAERLRDGLARTLVGGEYARIEQIRVGQRALPADGQTICGWLGETGHLYVIATHSGITLGPLLGRLAAEEILTDRVSGQLSPFRPGRFGHSVPAHLGSQRQYGDR